MNLQEQEAPQGEEQNADILVLGIGNLLMGDEGLGVHLARHLEQEQLPPGVAILDGGTAGFNLMSWLEEYPHVIMIDATLDDRPPGTIREIQPRFSTDFPAAMSTHDIGLKDLIGGLSLLGKMPDIHLFVVSIAELQEMQTHLSPAVESALPELKLRILKKIEDLRKKKDIRPH